MAKYIMFNYWSGNHSPYINRIHRLDGSEVSLSSLLEKLLNEAGIQDGDEFEITITRTGNRPFGNRRMILQEPYRYGLETMLQMRKRLRGSK